MSFLLEVLLVTLDTIAACAVASPLLLIIADLVAPSVLDGIAGLPSPYFFLSLVFGALWLLLRHGVRWSGELEKRPQMVARLRSTHVVLATIIVALQLMRIFFWHH